MRVESSSTTPLKRVWKNTVDYINKNLFEFAGTTTMMAGLAFCAKSVYDQAMAAAIAPNQIDLLAETATMRFGVTIGGIGMVAFFVGSLIDDKREERKRIEETRIANEFLRDSLLNDKSSDIALFAKGEGYKINQRRALLGKEGIPELDEFYALVAKINDSSSSASNIFENSEFANVIQKVKDAIVSQNLIEDHRIKSIKATNPKYSEPSFLD